MTTPIQFRLPNITTLLTRLFGIPKGTFGRGIYEPKAIILHSLRHTLDTYDAQVIHPELISYRDRAQVKHPSLHFAIDYDGAVHQYVNTLDVAWALWDYDNGHFPNPFPEGSFAWLATYPDVTPDMYSIHIGATSGEFGTQIIPPKSSIPMSVASILQHARLIAYLCHAYNITCNTTNVVRHETVDTQFVGECIGDATYPYTTILGLAQAIIAAGGESDIIFEFPPVLTEITGPFTVGVSRISSAAYISADA